MKKLVMLILMMSALMFGCGSETSGSISLSSPTNSGGVVTAEATYTPSSRPALTNQRITFYWYTVGLTSNVTINYPSKDSYTNGNGMALSELTLPYPRTETLRVYVKAGTGDLVSSTQFVDVAP